MKRILLFFAIALFLLTSCAAPKKSLQDEILGTWKNNDGYSIEFKDGGAGFIPGVPGKIPDSNFTYTIKDETHINLDLEGQVQTIEIQISGDKLTWRDDLGDVAYTRVK
jgi:hypothetical protein